MTVRGTPSAGTAADAVLDRFDRQLGEIGRRQHRFAWLRDPADSDWLAVDAYYPGNRVVVVSAADPAALAQCRQLVPAHGLKLVTLDGEELDAPSTAPARAPAERQPRASDHSPRDPRVSESDGMWLGIALVIVVVIELLLGGVVIGLRAGQYVLGFAFLLDACARVLGTVAASQNGDLDAAWTSVILGSPALWGADAANARGDAAPVARITAILAGIAGALGLVLLIL